MKLKAVDYEFLKGIVSWSLAGKDAPMCNWENSKFKNKPFKWFVRASYGGYQATYHVFGTPTQSRSLRYIKSIKHEIEKISN
jgi:hypothetical protein